MIGRAVLTVVIIVLAILFVIVSLIAALPSALIIGAAGAYVVVRLASVWRKL